MTGCMGNHSVNCIFVHGWAMNSAVWEECQSLLPEWINATFVDLPGHGTMADIAADSIDDYVRALIPLTHRPVLWVGWSFGALILIRLAELYPERVASLFLVAATPCFVQRSDWPAAIDKTTFIEFAKSLEYNQQKTLTRFLSLQMQGAENARQLLRQLQQKMKKRGIASAAALATGLQILLENDFRTTVAQLDCPVSWFFGARDTLIPVALADAIHQLYGRHKIYLEAAAAHAPFLSHPRSFTDALIAQARRLR